jgi:hypothetical protein
LRLYGSESDPSTASSRKIWYDSSPTWRVALASKLFTLMSPPSIVTNYLDVKITRTKTPGTEQAHAGVFERGDTIVQRSAIRGGTIWLPS